MTNYTFLKPDEFCAGRSGLGRRNSPLFLAAHHRAKQIQKLPNVNKLKCHLIICFGARSCRAHGRVCVQANAGVREWARREMCASAAYAWRIGRTQCSQRSPLGDGKAKYEELRIEGNYWLCKNKEWFNYNNHKHFNRNQMKCMLLHRESHESRERRKKVNCILKNFILLLEFLFRIYHRRNELRDHNLLF